MTPAQTLAAAVGEGLRLDADLRLEVDGRPLHLTGDGRRLTLHVDDLRTLARLRATTPDGRGGASDLASLATTLDELGLTLDVVGPTGASLATAGRDARPGVAGRLLDAPVAVDRRIGLLAAVTAAVAAAIVVLGVVRARSTPQHGSEAPS